MDDKDEGIVLSIEEKTLILFENFFTRQESFIMNPFTFKRINPKTKQCLQFIDHNNKNYFKLLNRMVHEIDKWTAYSPYAVRKYNKIVERGDITIINKELEKLRNLIEEKQKNK